MRWAVEVRTEEMSTQFSSNNFTLLVVKVAHYLDDNYSDTCELNGVQEAVEEIIRNGGQTFFVVRGTRKTAIVVRRVVAAPSHFPRLAATERTRRAVGIAKPATKK